MNTFARLASAVIAAAVFVVPASAMAVTKHKKAESAFPMKAEVFKKIVDGKIDKMKGHFEKGMKKRSLSHNQKADLDKTLEGALKELHSTVDKVSADGVVTKDEAKQVKRVSDQLRTKVREELRGKHASTKAKGQKPAKGKVAKKAKKAKKRSAEKAQKS
jgi:archaellum component FlaC